MDILRAMKLKYGAIHSVDPKPMWGGETDNSPNFPFSHDDKIAISPILANPILFLFPKLAQEGIFFLYQYKKLKDNFGILVFFFPNIK